MATVAPHDTICAIATPPGMGGIAVIRVSGSNAIAIVDTLFTPAVAAHTLTAVAPGRATYGTIYDGDEVIDEVIATPFHAPHSFTGENTVEVSCHGSLYIQQRLLALLIAHGCRMAQPGEFTRRAFASGRIDLSQAEAVADLIAAGTAQAHRLAMNQMRGQFSNRLAQLRDSLLQFVSLIELELDFSEEDLRFADRSHLLALAHEIAHEVARLTQSFAVGNAIKNGIPTTIIGETNAGKSTLLNLLAHDEKALVSDIHGTTRDVIEDLITLGGILFRIIDTAGIRDTTDTIESMGIARTYDKIDQSTIVVWLIDSTGRPEQITAMAQRLAPHCSDKQLIIAFNKTDLIDNARRDTLGTLVHELPMTPHDTIFISAKHNTGIDHLIAALTGIAQAAQTTGSDVIVTNLRHYEALTHALDAIGRVIDGLDSGIPTDFVAQDIRECMHYLGEITGEISTDEILGSIFSRFCIGK